MRIVTHDSSFHTDDVFAVATLLLLHDAEVVRSRDPEIQATADYVVDTGMVYDPKTKRFDHHQGGGAGQRENGIPYASFGLVWKEYGAFLAGGEREAALIDRELAQPIDAHDNGVAIATSTFEGVRAFDIGDFFSSFVTTREPEDLYKIFMHVVSIAKDLLVREIATAKQNILSEDKILEIYNSSVDKRVIIMPGDLTSWRYVLGNTPDALYAIYPRPDGQWSLKCIPDLTKPYGSNRKSLPMSWAAKEGKELQEVTGVPDAVFAHRGLFFAAARSKEGALALAQIALNA